MQTLGTIRTFRRGRFTVVVDAVEELDVDLSWDDDGEVGRKLERGEYVAFCARARCLLDGVEIASDYLGNCIYPSFGKFMDHVGISRRAPGCGSYFSDMVRNVCREGREAVRRMIVPYVRGARA